MQELKKSHIREVKKFEDEIKKLMNINESMQNDYDQLETDLKDTIKNFQTIINTNT